MRWTCSSSRYQRNPARHEVAVDGDAIADATHFFWRIAESDRVERAADAIKAAGPTIVFCRTRHRADRVAKRLGSAGVDAVAIHGGRSQPQRDRALRDFTTGRTLALVATDVAARGIHVDDVAAVVHFDLPPDPKDYVHRSGRTARAGQAGVVVALVAPDQRKDATKLARQVGLDVGLTDPDPDLLKKHLPDVSHVSRSRSTRRSGTRSRSERLRSPPGEAAEPVTPGSAKRARVASASERPRAKTNTARVRFYDARKGFGFVVRPGKDDLFVHATALGGIDPAELVEGRPVRYRVEQGRKGEQAAELHLAKAR